jgi:xanthine dehydrogenase accessory factor
MRGELPQLIELASRLLANNEPGILATLFSASGSSYRSLGSMMVGGPPGEVAGGISGGCLEEYIQRHGRELTRRCDATLLSFDTGSGEFEEAKPVLGCGGSIDVLIERLTQEHLAYLRRLAAAYDSDAPSLAACSIESTETSISVTRRWGRAGMDDSCAKPAHQALCDRRSYCGQNSATKRTLVHYIPPVTRLVILGAGEDVRPVCDLARSLGWHVTVADRRGRHARTSRFPSADAVIAAPWETALHKIRFTANTAILLMTHSLPDDAILLPLLANKPGAYVGVLGPAHRREGLLQLVVEAGPINEDFVARLRGPIGLDLGDRSATGIAVSVIAEIVAHLNDRSAAPMSDPSQPIAHSQLLSSSDA